MIKRYVDKAFSGKQLASNKRRQDRLNDLSARLAKNGYGRQSSAWLLGQIDIEEHCICELLHERADMYLEAYARNNMKIGPEVLQDISDMRGILTATRKSCLIAESKLISTRTNQPANAHFYAHLGKEGSQAMIEVQAKIDLHNLTPKKVEIAPVTNITYQLSGTGNRIVHGDDNSVNIINEQELFEQLANIVRANVAEGPQRGEILAHLNELKRQKTKTDYVAMVPKFITAASSIGHLIGPYLSALIQKAESLL